MTAPFDEAIYAWFGLQRNRYGLPQAWELLCGVLGVAPGVAPYLERYLADEQAALQQEWQTIEQEWARIFTMEEALKRRGVDHLTWSCPALETHPCRMWE